MPDLARGLSPLQPLGHTGYLALVAANIGAVVMPWMVFYQQGAVIDKGLGPQDLRARPGQHRDRRLSRRSS